MEQNNLNTLFFMSDISGFKKFVNETEIKHSRHIICELLEEIINSNNSGLQVAEIEGDPVFFYLAGTELSLADIAEQAKRMFINFHKLLNSQKLYRLCECNACKTARNLKLKMIVHYGQAQRYTIKSITS